MKEMQAAVWLIKGILSELDGTDAEKIDRMCKRIEETMAEDGDEMVGKIALARLGLKHWEKEILSE